MLEDQMNDPNFDDDAELDQLLATIGSGNAAPEAPVEEPAAPVSEPAQEQPTMNEQTPAGDGGPGDRGEALRQERERRRAVEAELQSYRQREAQQQEQQRAAMDEESIIARAEGMYAEDVAKLVKEREALAFKSAQQQAEETFKKQRETLSLNYLKQSKPDALERIGNLIETLGDDVFMGLHKQALDQDDPAGWLYEKASKIPLPGEVERLASEQAQTQLAQTLQKEKAPVGGSTPQLAHLGGGNAAPMEDIDPENLSDADLKKLKSKQEALYNT